MMKFRNSILLAVMAFCQVYRVQGELHGLCKVTLLRVALCTVPFLFGVNAAAKSTRPRPVQAQSCNVIPKGRDLSLETPGDENTSEEEVYKGLELRLFPSSSEEPISERFRKFMNSLIKLGSYKFIDVIGSSEEDLTYAERMDKWRKSLKNFFENKRKKSDKNVLEELPKEMQEKIKEKIKKEMTKAKGIKFSSELDAVPYPGPQQSANYPDKNRKKHPNEYANLNPSGFLTRQPNDYANENSHRYQNDYGNEIPNTYTNGYGNKNPNGYQNGYPNNHPNEIPIEYQNGHPNSPPYGYHNGPPNGYPNRPATPPPYGYHTRQPNGYQQQRNTNTYSNNVNWKLPPNVTQSGCPNGNQGLYPQGNSNPYPNARLNGFSNQNENRNSNTSINGYPYKNPSWPPNGHQNGNFNGYQSGNSNSCLDKSPTQNVQNFNPNFNGISPQVSYDPAPSSCSPFSSLSLPSPPPFPPPPPPSPKPYIISVSHSYSNSTSYQTSKNPFKNPYFDYKPGVTTKSGSVTKSEVCMESNSGIATFQMPNSKDENQICSQPKTNKITITIQSKDPIEIPIEGTLV